MASRCARGQNALAYFFDPSIKGAEFLIRKAGIGFCKSHEFFFFGIPEAKGIIGKEVAAPAVAAHGVGEHGVYGERVNFPFPPVAFLRPTR